MGSNRRQTELEPERMVGTLKLEKRKYGCWSSPLTAEMVTSNLVGFAELRCVGSHLYFIESRPDEGGRSVLCRLDLNGNFDEISPPELSVRTTVHEYGGGAYCVTESHAYVVHVRDQDIYEIDLEDGDCRNITNSGTNERFADLHFDNHHQRLVAVREKHHPDREAENDLVAIDCQTGQLTLLHSGHDFYSSPRISADGKSIAFLVWDHPFMPFDGTQLALATLAADGSIVHTTFVVGGSDEAIVQPAWLNSERLLFMSDVNGFWNPFLHVEEGTFCVFEEETEYAGPHWVFGARSYAALNQRVIIACRNRVEGEDLVFIDCESQLLSPFDDSFDSYASITVWGDGVAFIAGRTDDLDAIVFKSTDGTRQKILRTQGKLAVEKEFISPAKAIQFPNEDGDTVYAFLYEPLNPTVEADEHDQPPLLVLSHGGPTSQSNPTLDYRIQYYTTRGWTVLNVNYGGSTGFGREYRNRLKDNWGILDVTDCEAGVRHLVTRGMVDPAHVAIKGGSAGGYTTLRALSTSSTFKAGASHYGVADVQALIDHTHKFESRYIDGLIPMDQVEARSPVHSLDRFNCPVIFFQGTEDRVVPPAQSQAMYDALAKKGIPTALMMYEGEAHGFRDGKNIRQSIEAELLFFSLIFGLQPADVDASSLEKASLANWT